MVDLTPFWISVETGLQQGVQTQHRVKGVLQRGKKKKQLVPFSHASLLLVKMVTDTMIIANIYGVFLE